MATTSGYQQIGFHIRGVAPLILHNGLLNDALEERAQILQKAVKLAKKDKTETAILEVARLEFLGSLYVDEKQAPCIPSEVMEAAIRSGAKITKEGKAVQTGLFCEGNFPLIYDGPKDPDKLWESRGEGEKKGPIAGRRFVDRRRARVGQNAVMRTRPIFHSWELKFVVNYDPQMLNKKSIIEFVEVCGQRCGLCEIRPRFGRYEVVEVFDIS